MPPPTAQLFCTGTCRALHTTTGTYHRWTIPRTSARLEEFERVPTGVITQNLLPSRTLDNV